MKYWSTLSSLRRFRALPKLPVRSPRRLKKAPLLAAVQGFGPNPGNLNMFMFRPSEIGEASALVVVLHGCGQTAERYDHGSGWSSLANRYGFSLLMPEQKRTNNPYQCFSWFQPQDTQRAQGEAASIRQMIDRMVADYSVDPRQIFITGLSAGAAMTSAMLACYPEVFGAGAMIAGLPYGSASTARQAFRALHDSSVRTPDEWAEVVRLASPAYEGPWPRIAVWHGDADRTVAPNNALEIIKQWTCVHGLGVEPTREDTIDGYPRQSWLYDNGEEIIQSYRIPQMAHGTPLSTGDAEGQCGTAGRLFLDVGISSSFRIAQFFGLIRTT